ncbi:class I SAM-dependent methyltransferase [Pseudokineococcus basanitobsidens]|uniref:Class I SAM-dependent methyltransferase n=1 Tax=Pseudokineococcus basanitobsidens TaxID=1926649 RepID=A0ABU8RKY4_9ACTN
MTVVGTGVHPIDLYDEALRGARDGSGVRWRWRSHDGSVAELPVLTWSADLDDADRLVVERCTGPALDVGCGPGRLAAALTGRVPVALGIDVSREAVRLTRQRGGSAERRDVFGSVPGAGTWQHVLLADGNVGIGGDAVALLRRAGELLAPGGEVVCEVGPPGSPTGPALVRLEADGRASDWFGWDRVACDDVERVAGQAGLVVVDAFSAPSSGGRRWFACLVAS